MVRWDCSGLEGWGGTGWSAWLRGNRWRSHKIRDELHDKVFHVIYRVQVRLRDITSSVNQLRDCWDINTHILARFQRIEHPLSFRIEPRMPSSRLRRTSPGAGETLDSLPISLSLCLSSCVCSRAVGSLIAKYTACVAPLGAGLGRLSFSLPSAGLGRRGVGFDGPAGGSALIGEGRRRRWTGGV